jgi:molecular chaperone DnaJ
MIRLLVALFVVVAATPIRAASHHNGHNSNPFAILGIPNSATQAEIKQRYRRLCLEYHPDKKLHLPAPQRAEYERKFKELQSAYELIGTPTARRAFQQNQRYNQHFDFRQSTRYNTQYSGSTTNNNRDSPTHRGEFPFGFPFSLFSPHTDNDRPFRSSPWFAAATSAHSRFPFATTATKTSWKSIHVQRVTVPLRDLYTGQPNFEFCVQHDNAWTRLVAAVRGKLAWVLLYKSVVASIPALMFSRKLALLSLVCLFLSNLPPLSPRSPSQGVDWGSRMDPSDHSLDSRVFRAHLQPGYKTNTRLIFNAQHTGHERVEVHFVLREDKHPIYTRIGNNLHIHCTITRRQARRGCRVSFPTLSDPTVRLYVTIPRRTAPGDEIVVPGEGWPNRKRHGIKGDLIVTVHVSSARFSWKREKSTV